MNKLIISTPEEFADLIRTILREEIHSLTGSRTTEKNLLTLTEASEYLKIPTSTLYQFTSQRNIPFTKSGRRLLFIRAELDTWLAGRRKATRQEMSEEIKKTFLS